MIIALPSQDGNTLSGHFGRSPIFAVYETADGEIKKKELRKNAGAHGHGECSHGSHDKGGGHHCHTTLLETLHDVDLVISAGMGKKMYDDLVHAGKIVLLSAEDDCDTIVNKFLSGNLQSKTSGFCGCNH